VGYTLKVTTDDVHAKAQRVQSEAADLEAKVAKLTSDMQALADTWTGTASGKFQGLYHGWQGQARQIQSSLEQIGTSLNSVGTNYDQVEAQNAASL
jgi:WXG100 family type VII secretion target